MCNSGHQRKGVQSVPEPLSQWQLYLSALSFNVLFARHQFLVIKDPHRIGVMWCVTNQNELGKNSSNGHISKKINVWTTGRIAA